MRVKPGKQEHTIFPSEVPQVCLQGPLSRTNNILKCMRSHSQAQNPLKFQGFIPLITIPVMAPECKNKQSVLVTLITMCSPLFIGTHTCVIPSHLGGSKLPHTAVLLAKQP